MAILYSKVTTGPDVEPITLTEAKLHCRIDNNEEDALIDLFRQVAREMTEQATNRSLITQTRVMKMDYFPRNFGRGFKDDWASIFLPYGPVQSVTSVVYYDKDDVEQTLNSSLYWVDKDSDIARIIAKDSWPGTYERPNAVTITYEAGYGDSGASVPKPLRAAMLLVIGHLYENRQQVIMSGSPTAALELPFGFETLVSQYKVDQNVNY